MKLRMTVYLTLVLLILLPGCAMPGKKLFSSVDAPCKIEDIQDFKEVPQSFWGTQVSCYAIGFKRRPISSVVSLSMLAPILGCADIKVRDGKVIKCHVYYSKGDEYTRKHELKHCEGYKDTFF